MKSGIYSILNKINNVRYIGSAVNLNVRKNRHFNSLLKGNHHNNYLQNAYNKYGIVNFEFSILEYVDNKELLIIREQFYIDFYLTQNMAYNLCPTAGSLLGIKHSKESVQQMVNTRIKNDSFKCKEESKEKIRNANIGKKYGDKTKDKHRANCLGSGNPFYGKTHSLETKQKITNSYASMSDEKKKIRSEKIRQSRLGKSPVNKGVPMKEEAKRKMIETKRKNKEGKVLKQQLTNDSYTAKS